MTKVNVYPLILLLGVIGCSENNQPTSAGQEQQSKAKSVVAIEIKPQEITSGDEIPGRVEPYAVAEIRPQVTGIIEQLFFDQGSYVEKGKQLFQIDDANFRAELNRAKALLSESKAVLEVTSAREKRIENLRDTNAVSEQEYENVVAEKTQAQAAVDVAKANVEAAQVKLDYTKVMSPISGFIGPSSVTQGALVTANQATVLATVRQLDPIYVDLSQSAGDMQSSAVTQDGAKERFEVELLLGQNKEVYGKKGKLFATNLAINEDTETVQLRSIFSNPDGRLLPGMFVRARIEDKQAKAEILVPQRAVNIDRSGQKSVWVLDENSRVQPRPIKSDHSYQNSWVVKTGLQEGDIVITDGMLALKPGMKVKANIKNSAQVAQENRNTSQEASSNQSTNSL